MNMWIFSVYTWWNILTNNNDQSNSLVSVEYERNLISAWWTAGVFEIVSICINWPYFGEGEYSRPRWLYVHRDECTSMIHSDDHYTLCALGFLFLHNTHWLAHWMIHPLTTNCHLLIGRFLLSRQMWANSVVVVTIVCKLLRNYCGVV